MFALGAQDRNVDAIIEELEDSLFDEVLQELRKPKPVASSRSALFSILKGNEKEEDENDTSLPPTEASHEFVSPFLEDKTPVHDFPLSLFTLRVEQLFSHVTEALDSSCDGAEWRHLTTRTSCCAFCRQFHNYAVHDRGSALFHRYVCEEAAHCSKCCIPITSTEHRCGLLCPFCPQVYSNQSSLSHHIRALHAVPFCRDCYEPDFEPFRQFYSPKAARHHVMRLHARDPISGAGLACPTCGEERPGTLALMQHFQEMQNKHQDGDLHRVLQCVKCCCRIEDDQRFLAHSSCLLPPSKRGQKDLASHATVDKSAS